LPTISLFVLDFVELPTASYHSQFRLLDVAERHVFSEDLVLHVLELPKVPAPSGNVEAAPTVDEPLLLKWARFLKAETPDVLESLAMTDPVFREAKDALERLSDDPKARELARERELWDFNYRTSISLAKKEGRAEGRLEGRAAGERLLLHRQLARRFGELPAYVLDRLEGATEAELESWADRILTASTLDDVFAPR